MSWVGHFSVMTPIRQYIQLLFTERAISCYTIAGAAIEVTNFVNYICQDDGKITDYIVTAAKDYKCTIYVVERFIVYIKAFCSSSIACNAPQKH